MPAIQRETRSREDENGWQSEAEAEEPTLDQPETSRNEDADPIFRLSGESAKERELHRLEKSRVKSNVIINGCLHPGVDHNIPTVK
jgi:hypothetical protein